MSEPGHQNSIRYILSPLSERGRSPAPLIRSVSQVSFEIQGEKPFENSINETVTWIRNRNRAIPQNALNGSPFEIGGGGDAPAQAVALEFEGGRVWAASLDDPDSNVLGRTWVTEVTVGEQAGKVHFGARLINVTRRHDAAYVPSLPGIARQIISKLPSVADDVRLLEYARRIATEEDVDNLIALMDDPTRQCPIVAIAEPVTREQFVSPDVLARRLAGACHVVYLNADATWALTRRVGNALSVFNGGARLYRAGFRADGSDPFQHPLWIPRPGASFDGRTDLVVARVLSSTVNTGRKDDYPRFNIIRQAAANRAIEERRLGASDSDLIRLYEEENVRLTTELETARSEVDLWLEDTETSKLTAERELAEVKSELARARAQNDALRAALSGGDTSDVEKPLENLRKFDEWARENLSTNVLIAPKAIKEVEKNGVFEDPGLLGAALLMLDQYYVPMRRDPGETKRAAYELRLQDLHCEDQPCFRIRGQIKAYPAYQVHYLGTKYWCDQHIKFGGGTDPKKYFRIYFYWQEEEQILIIGHLPTHLDNNLTN